MATCATLDRCRSVTPAARNAGRSRVRRHRVTRVTTDRSATAHGVPPRMSRRHCRQSPPTSPRRGSGSWRSRSSPRVLLGTPARSRPTRFGAGDRFDRLLAQDRPVHQPGRRPDRPAPVTVRDHRRRPTGTAADRDTDPTPTRLVSLGRPRRRPPCPTPVPTPTPTPAPEASRGRRHRHRPQGGLRPRGQGHLVRAGRRPDDPRDPGPRRHVGTASSASSRAGSRSGRATTTATTALWGPSAMALALDAYGAPGYEVRAYKTRRRALRDAARAIQDDEVAGHPAGLARGAHLGDDRLPGGRRPGRLPVRQDLGRLHPRPVVPVEFEHLGPVRPARDVPGRRRR